MTMFTVCYWTVTTVTFIKRVWGATLCVVVVGFELSQVRIICCIAYWDRGLGLNCMLKHVCLWMQICLPIVCVSVFVCVKDSTGAWTTSVLALCRLHLCVCMRVSLVMLMGTSLLQSGVSIVVSHVQFLRQCVAVELSGVIQVWNINVFSAVWASVSPWNCVWDGVFVCVQLDIIWILLILIPQILLIPMLTFTSSLIQQRRAIVIHIYLPLVTASTQ